MAYQGEYLSITVTHLCHNILVEHRSNGKHILDLVKDQINFQMIFRIE